MNFSQVALAFHDLSWASQDFKKYLGEFLSLDTGEVIQTDKKWLYLYGSNTLLEQIDDTHILFKEKEEISFIPKVPAQVKMEGTDATYYAVISPSTYFLCTTSPEIKFARCHDRPTWYPLVAYGSMY